MSKRGGELVAALESAVNEELQRRFDEDEINKAPSIVDTEVKNVQQAFNQFVEAKELTTSTDLTAALDKASSTAANQLTRLAQIKTRQKEMSDRLALESNNLIEQQLLPLNELSKFNTKQTGINQF